MQQSVSNPGIDDRLESAIVELLALQEVLSGEEVDARVLGHFRDALNLVRNTAWAAQKFVASRLSDQGPAGLTSFLAAERVRAAFRMCRSVQEDLNRDEVEFQRGQLSELDTLIRGLSEQLKDRI